MKEQFINDLTDRFPEHSFTKTSSKKTPLYIYEVSGLSNLEHTIKFTIMTESEPQERNLKVINMLNQNPITHICIDGDFINYGQEKYDYNSTNKKDGRPDCIVFDEKTFLFVELKLNQEDTSFDKEKSKWNRFFDGVTQIENFVSFLRDNNFEIKDYFPNINAILCMRFEPKFSSNTARNREKYARSLKLGFEIKALNYFEF
ncbi:hypothetical protein [Arcicella rosea]|uniref:Uncharacterized protein n=1 Tax=Arcicella rosea TaxID=502909 RepID=A0A841EKN8_9BACT|nr:hypothetical protein [Arcicella rosea]MBB6001979.1 hypothetical protein [Arcicella rosea]